MLFLGLLVACTDVRVDPDGTGGWSAAPDAASATGAETGTDTASTGAPVPICEQLCDVTGNCFDDCQGMCAKLEQAQCAAEAQAYLACLVEHYDAAICATASPFECNDAALDVLACEGSATCGPEACHSSRTGCSCIRECPYGEQQITCNFAGDQALCTCAFNGQPTEYAGGPNDGAASCSLVTSACVDSFGPTP